MIVNRLKPQVKSFESDNFYIFECINGMYQLRDSETHMVISTSTDLEGLKMTFKRLLGRYKNYTNYQKAMNSLSEPGVSPRIAKRREEEYKKVGERYRDLVEEIVNNHNNTGTKSLRRSPIGVPSVDPTQKDKPQEVPSPRKSLLRRRNKIS